ncbi:MAG: sorbosone dehydrogenase family protein, partial [Rhodanobacteraceae bacterium]
MRRAHLAAAVVAALSLCVACAHQSVLPPDAGMGPAPELPAPEEPKLFPTVAIAPAQGWPEGTKPTPAAGLAVNAFAADLAHPRWLYVLP